MKSMEIIYHVCEWDEMMTCPVMSKDGKASCALYSHKEQPEVLILANLYVDPSRRKEGCAKELLRFSEKFAQERGYESIKLKADLAAWMRSWYEREGFVFDALDDDDLFFAWFKKSVA